MRKGRLSGRSLALGGTVVSLATLVTACYQSIWKADYSSSVDQARNYSVTSAVDNAGNLLVGGSSTVVITQDDAGNPIVHFQPTLLKYSASGTLLWEFHFDNGRRRSTAQPASYDYINEYTGGAEISQIVLDTQGNIFAAGIVPGVNYATDSADYDLAVFKLDAAGTLQWQRIIERPSQDSPLALSLSQSGHLLLGVGHVSGLFNSAAEALALSASNGSTLWSHEEADTDFAHTFLFSYRETAFAQSADAVASTSRLAVGNDFYRVRVYDETGNLLYRVPAIPDSATQSGPDIGPACSGDVGGFEPTLAMGFDGNELVITRAILAFGCTYSASELQLTHYDNAGQQVWSTKLPDSLPYDWTEEYEQWSMGERDSFTPFSRRSLFQNARMTVHDSGIYIAASGISDLVTPRLDYDAVANTVDTQVYAVEKNGALRWHHGLHTTPVIKWQPFTENKVENVIATWITARDITVTAQGNPVVALNDLEAHGLTYNYSNLSAVTTLEGISSRLVEFNAATGKQDSFGTEKDQWGRSVTAANGKGVFKVGDNHRHVPAWWMANPAGVASTPSALHISHYRQR